MFKRLIAVSALFLLTFSFGCTSEVEDTDVVIEDEVVEEEVAEESSEVDYAELVDTFFKAFSEEGGQAAYDMMTSEYQATYAMDEFVMIVSMMQLSDYASSEIVEQNDNVLVVTFVYSGGETLDFDMTWEQVGDEWKVSVFQMIY